MIAAIIGFGGLGHIAAQVLRSLCAGTIIIVDSSVQALKLAEDMGFAHRVMGGRGAVDDVKRLTEGGADAVIDFVGEKGTPEQGMAMLRRGGTYYVVGYGGTVQVPTIDLIFGEFNIVGNLVGNFPELSELMTLAAQGVVKLATRTYRLDQVNEAMHDLIGGRLTGRGVLVP
jgi:NAD+-dependent secondary alcohol dehydrogenase Adh1